jgi:adenosylcobinamide-phosphate synthase
MTAVDLLLACALDAAIGDPRWLPHPVRGMGYLANRFEQGIQVVCTGTSALRVAGVVLAVSLPLVAFLLGWVLIAAGMAVNDWMGRGVEIFLAATTLAWRDLMHHVGAVAASLNIASLSRAREAVGLIVGRDTDRLSESEIVRATVETLAESASDGVIAPLFYLAIGGAPLALAYKAVSTLDSIVGHRNERYRDFGWASARLDDLANWIPARLTAVMTVMAAGINFQRMKPLIRGASILWRDGHKHPSPNSGRAEASMVGALGIRLGGINTYDGLPEQRPFLGEAVEPLSITHIEQAKSIVTIAYLMAVGGAVGYLWLW